MAGVILLLVSIGSASAADQFDPDDVDTTTQPGVGGHEVWAGVDASANNWLVYAGTTTAPWGDIHEDGLRLRSTIGYGRYSYVYSDAYNSIKKTRTITTISVQKSTADALVGYQLRAGQLTAKAFFGIALLKNELETPFATLAPVQIDTGLKGAVEFWLNLGQSGFGAFDVSYADTRATFSARTRAGLRVWPAISVGLEATYNRSDLTGQVQLDDAVRFRGTLRTGGFVRAEWFGGEISASGGVSGDVVESRTGTDVLHKPMTYGTLSWIMQY
jgi:hypothetical protein